MKTILIIDDDEEMRTAFSTALQRNGYHTLEAVSGVKGLEMARQHLPDLILSDIQMPGGDGATLLQNLRADQELRSKQVILMTGRPELVTPRKAMDAGADDYLTKPVTMEALLSCVEARFKRASISWRVEDQMLNQLRSSVPAHLPHEFFTPMAGIIGLLEILRYRSSSLESQEIADIHGDLYSSALRLNRTLRNYLLILELQKASPGPLIGTLTSEQAEKSIRSGVKEALRINPRHDDVTISLCSCPLRVSAGDLTPMVEELVDNACKFSRQGTPIEILLGSDGKLIVRDEGRGLTSEQIMQIGAFQQFERSKHEQQGLGLGLALVQKLAASCGAMVSIKSKAGTGTEITVAFSTSKPTEENL